MAKTKGGWNSLSVPGTSDAPDSSNTPKTEKEIYEAADDLVAKADPVEEDDEDEDLGRYSFAAGESDDEDEDLEDPVEEEEPEAEPAKPSTVTAADDEPKQPKETRSTKRFHQLVSKIKSKDEQLAQMRAQALRDREELEQRLSEYEAALASTMGSSAEDKIKAAKERLRKAKNEADTEAEIEATAELQEAYSYKVRAEDIKSSIPAKREAKQITNEAVLADYKVKAWGETNKHIVSSPYLMETALKVDNEVRRDGFLPHTDSYYEEVNKRVNKVFKENGLAVKAHSIYNFGVEDDDAQEDTDEEPAPQAPAAKAPVAPAPKKVNPLDIGPRSAATNSKKQVGRITPKEQAFANRMGVPPDVLFKQQRLSEAKNKFGYSPVYIPQKKK